VKRTYTAVTNTTDRDADLFTALRWARAMAGDGQRVTLWCHSQDALPKGLGPAAAAHGIAVHAERPRPRGGGQGRNFGGPVVAVGLGLDTLVEIEPFPHPVCLVHAYVPENDEREWSVAAGLPFDRPWVDAFRPQCLAGPAIVPTEPLISDPVVACAMEAFTSSTFDGTTMYDSRDGGRVTHGLMELRRGGHVIEPERLFSAALRAGWRGRQALMFRDVAREVAQGVNKRPRERYRQDILAHWRAEAVARA